MASRTPASTEQAVVKAWRAGVPQKKIPRRCHVTQQTVSKILKRALLADQPCPIPQDKDGIIFSMVEPYLCIGCTARLRHEVWVSVSPCPACLAAEYKIRHENA